MTAGRSTKGIMSEPEVTEWRERIEKSLTEVRDILKGTEFKSGLVSDHKLMFTAVFGDEKTGAPGLARDMRVVKSFKSWVTHSLTGALGAITLAIIAKMFGLQF